MDNTIVATAPVQERLDRLCLCIERAVRGDRPAILLVVCRSDFIRRDVEACLAEKIQDLGKKIVHIQVSETVNDIPVALRDHPERDDSVFFVSGLRWDGAGGRKAYRSLNFRREYFTEYNMKAVIWLTEEEAAELPLYATDFWVFRHQAAYFVDEILPPVETGV